MVKTVVSAAAGAAAMAMLLKEARKEAKPPTIIMKNTEQNKEIVEAIPQLTKSIMRPWGWHSDTGSPKLADDDVNSDDVNKMQECIDYLITECLLKCGTHDCQGRGASVAGSVISEIGKQYQEMVGLLQKVDSIFSVVQKHEAAKTPATECGLDSSDEVVTHVNVESRSPKCDRKPEDEMVAKVQPLSVEKDDDEVLFLVDTDSENENGIDDQSSSSPATSKKKKKRRKRKKKNSTDAAISSSSTTQEPVDPPPRPSPDDPSDAERIVRLDAWLAKGAHLSRAQARDTIMLLDASVVGHVKATRALLQKPGIRVLKKMPIGTHQGTHDQFTPLHFASHRGHAGVVELLLTRPEIQVDRGPKTPLMLAAFSGHQDVVKILLDAGADKDKFSSVQVFRPIELERSKYFDDTYTPLYAACQNGHSGVVKILLAAGADMNKQNNDAFTPLYAASQCGHPVVVKALLDFGADFDSMNNVGYTALIVAAGQGHPEVVSALLNAGSDINRKSKEGTTALHIASQNGQCEVVKVLLNASPKADINQLGISGITPLLLASAHAHSDVVKILIDAGADIERPAEDGDTPLTAAMRNSHHAVINVILKARAQRCNEIIIQKDF